MAHRTLKSSAYEGLVERLNRFPQGAPPSKTLYEILKILVTEKEAGLIAQLPIKPFRAAEAARRWKLSAVDSRNILDELADRAILVDIEEGGEPIYVLPPPMAGFFEFSLMRLRGDVDQQVLAELFYQYLNVEEDFIKNLFVDGQTQLGRVFVNEAVIADVSADHALQVLDYERASEVIKSARHIGVGLCYCRHKMEHLGKNCSAPLDICMTFNSSAESLTRSGHARAIDVAECLDLLDQAYEHNLVQFGENVQNRVNFICNCCGCCCEAMIAARKYGILQPVHTSNFVARVTTESCTGCAKCIQLCPVEAIGLVSANDPHQPKRNSARVTADICLGCGVCVRVCGPRSLSLMPRARRVFTPVDNVHRIVVMAIERGKLQHLIFDNQVLFSHRALAALLGAVLNLSPVKRALASEQMKSRYLVKLLQWHSRR
ncbi:MAG: 4Fe-4S dicluster domain-containing protein [Desulfuromonadales bacterium]|nr:4Fe-4S dicluster domain-containing protein [Desulfuromonadales bacterium]